MAIRRNRKKEQKLIPQSLPLGESLKAIIKKGSSKARRSECGRETLLILEKDEERFEACNVLELLQVLFSVA